MTKMMVIIGSGPASWTAALYAARANLRPLVFAGLTMGGQRGGQLMLTNEVENYPGFPLGLGGPELIKLMEEQARRFGLDVLEEDVLEVEKKGDLFIVKGSSTVVEAHTVVVSTGAYAKRLDVKGNEELWGRGISACAVCDGAIPYFRNQKLAVIGGGDSACEEAHFLTKYGEKVYLILRRDEFRASKIMEERVKATDKIEIIYSHTVEEIFGENAVEGIKIKDVKSGEIKDLAVKGVFYAIGHQPNSGFVKSLIELDKTGYIVTKDGTTATSQPGIFGAGDVMDSRYRQAITAAGSGCMAALDAEKYIVERGIVHEEVPVSEKGEK